MGVARSLLRSGLSISGYDVRSEACKQFEKLGGVAASCPGQVGHRSRVVIILVVDAAQTEEVIFGVNGLAESMEPGSVIVSSSTVPPVFAAELGHRIESAGLMNIDAPVSGGTKGAVEGQLTVMASGPPAAF
jgi:3-hydroxyisobutyrate dehydrogenase